MSRATLKDIARELSISPSTVSRALRDHPDINPKTKKRVAEAAERLDYYPDSLAQGLKGQRTNTIGIIVPEIKIDNRTASIVMIFESINNSSLWILRN